MRSYRSLEAWKRAHAAALLANRAADAANDARSKSLLEQLKRATVSVEANIVEGYALNTAPLCRRHLRIAFGSAAEAECVAVLAGELRYLDQNVVADLERILGDAMRVLLGLMRSPPVSRHKGD